MNEETKYRPGDPVWVLERDECDEPIEVSGYMFIAEAHDYVILSAYINDLDNVDETLEYHAEETRNNYDTDLAVFPKADCFATQEAAHEALEK